MIFFVYPDPKGSEENQFTPLGAGVNKLIFKRYNMNIKYLLFTSIWLILASCSQKSSDLVDFVNPNIGGIRPLLETTVPLVNLPNSMMRIHRLPGNYQAEKIKGFPFILCGHRNGTAGLLMPTSGVSSIDQGKWKPDYLQQMPDATGLVGQFVMGNEPGLHIPYLYNYAGAPWKTQQRVRMLLDTWFTNSPFGIPGDEDGGGLSAFVVFSSMGFYPVTPGTPAFNIGSPVFTNVSVKLQNNKTFRIVAKDSNRQNKYIQNAILNGKQWNKPWFGWDDIKDGAVLELDMGSRPNYNWGSDPDDAPPSRLSN